MSLGGAKFSMKIDETRLNNALRGRDGEVGKVMAAFAGQVTKDIKEEFRKSAGGAYWPVVSSISVGQQGPVLAVTVKRTKPHAITAKSAPNLVFFWQREGRVFVGPAVSHPGSQPPVKLVLSGIDAAKRSLQVSTVRAVTTTF